jgi:putative oxidoreductase
MSKGKNIGLWVVQVLLAAVFISAGWSKLAGAPAMVGMYETLGMGQWFRYATGGLEVGSGILLLIPGLAGFGAALLVCVMVGAILTHLMVLHSSPAVPVILLVLTAAVLWGRWSQVAGRFARMI